jgi:hypothetical protein
VFYDINRRNLAVGAQIVYPVRHGANVEMKAGWISGMKCACGSYLIYRGTAASSSHGDLQYIRVIRKDNKEVKLVNFRNIVVTKTAGEIPDA